MKAFHVEVLRVFLAHKWVGNKYNGRQAQFQYRTRRPLLALSILCRGDTWWDITSRWVGSIPHSTLPYFIQRSHSVGYIDLEIQDYMIESKCLRSHSIRLTIWKRSWSQKEGIGYTKFSDKAYITLRQEPGRSRPAEICPNAQFLKFIKLCNEDMIGTSLRVDTQEVIDVGLILTLNCSLL